LLSHFVHEILILMAFSRSILLFLLCASKKMENHLSSPSLNQLNNNNKKNHTSVITILFEQAPSSNL